MITLEGLRFHGLPRAGMREQYICYLRKAPPSNRLISWATRLWWKCWTRESRLLGGIRQAERTVECRQGGCEAVMQLLVENGATTNAKNKNGWTPLS